MYIIKKENKEDIINDKSKMILNKFLENPLLQTSLSW